MSTIIPLILSLLEKGAKGFWWIVFIALLIIPFGIPILITIALIKAWRNKK